MELKIAVLMGSHGQSISLKETGVIKLFQKDSDHWKVSKEIIFGLGDALDLQQIQSRIRAMVEELGDCKIIVAAKVVGITAAILEGLGCIVWQVAGSPADFLDKISQEIFRENESFQWSVSPMPNPNGRPGYYFLDLKKSLENKSGIK